MPRLNIETLEQHIGEVGVADEALAYRLRGLMEQYDFDGISEILDSMDPM